MSLRRFVILLIVLPWCAYVQCARRTVDCEKVPYHYRCRGVQTRKRFMSMGNEELGERPSAVTGARMKDSYDYRQSLASAMDQDMASLSKSQLWAILQRSYSPEEIYASLVLPSRRNKKKVSSYLSSRDVESEKHISSLKDRRLPSSLEELTPRIELLADDAPENDY